MPTLMWEARAAHGCLEDLIEFARSHAAASAQIYRGADDRVVVIDPSGRGLPEAPAHLLARPAHQWRFEPVDRR